VLNAEGDEPDIYPINSSFYKLESELKGFIICSDGLLGAKIYDLTKVFALQWTQNGKLNILAENLVNYAYHELNSSDNISVIVIKIGEEKTVKKERTNIKTKLIIFAIILMLIGFPVYRYGLKWISGQKDQVEDTQEAITQEDQVEDTQEAITQEDPKDSTEIKVERNKIEQTTIKDQEKTVLVDNITREIADNLGDYFRLTSNIVRPEVYSSTPLSILSKITKLDEIKIKLILVGQKNSEIEGSKLIPKKIFRDYQTYELGAFGALFSGVKPGDYTLQYLVQYKDEKVLELGRKKISVKELTNSESLSDDIGQSKPIKEDSSNGKDQDNEAINRDIDAKNSLSEAEEEVAEDILEKASPETKEDSDLLSLKYDLINKKYEKLKPDNFILIDNYVVYKVPADGKGIWDICKMFFNSISIKVTDNEINELVEKIRIWKLKIK